MSTEAQRIYRVSYVQQGKVYEIFVRQVSQGGLFGFVEVEGLLFGERSQVVLDPSEEQLKSEFEGVRRVYLPLHSILRIDEVEKAGTPRISEAAGAGEKVSRFPVPIYSPGGSDKR